MTSSADDKSAVEGTPLIINGVSQPRKRSKVSRACDSCRRKKIKCNGEYSSSMQKVTLICDNCIKNGDECTYSRVPLKRGPSKGYIRDVDEKIDGMPRKRSIDQSAQQPLPFPQGHLSRNSVPGIHSGQSPIILPPLVGIQSKAGLLPNVQKLNNDSSPSSPRTNGVLSYKSDLPHPVSQSIADKTNSPPIQGPFWKVPYEMPPDVGLASSANSIGRKSSVDSVSSISTSGSRISRLPSLKATNSISSSEGIGVSDSESEEYYSSRSRRPSSQSLSPRNSISSLSSLNNRLGKDLTLNSSQYISPPNQQKHLHLPQIPHLGNKQHTQPSNYHIYYYANSGSSPLAVPVESNIKLYYSKFHDNLPILPFNETSLLRRVEATGESNKLLFDIFNHALNNLNNFKNLTLNDSISLMNRIQAMYPFNNFGIKVNDDVIFLYFSSLLLLNYSIILSGNHYSLGITFSMGIFNDFRVLENFVDLINRHHTPKDYDSIELYLPKLYYCLMLFDNLNALSFGVQKVLNNPLLKVLEDNVQLVCPSDQVAGGMTNLKYSSILDDFIQERDDLRLKVSFFHNGVKKTFTEPMIATFSSHFMKLINQKMEVTAHMIEIRQFLGNVNERKSFSFDVEEFIEVLGDHHLKSVRLVKKLSNAILNFANYISTSSNSDELTNPYLNISFGQLFKLIKLCKLFIDSLVPCNPGNVEITNRCVKINNDLSISFNLLNLNQNNLSLGSESVMLIRQKVEQYNLSFNMPHIAQRNEHHDLKERANVWKDEFLNSIFPFFEREAYEGWY